MVPLAGCQTRPPRPLIVLGSTGPPQAPAVPPSWRHVFCVEHQSQRALRWVSLTSPNCFQAFT